MVKSVELRSFMYAGFIANRVWSSHSSHASQSIASPLSNGLNHPQSREANDDQCCSFPNRSFGILCHALIPFDGLLLDLHWHISRLWELSFCPRSRIKRFGSSGQVFACFMVGFRSDFSKSKNELFSSDEGSPVVCCRIRDL